MQNKKLAQNIAQLLFSNNPDNYNLAFTLLIPAGIDEKPFFKMVADEYLNLIGLDILSPKDIKFITKDKVGCLVVQNNNSCNSIQYSLGVDSFIAISVSLYDFKNAEIIYSYYTYGYCNKGQFALGLHTSPKIWALSQTVANFLLEYFIFWKRYKKTPSEKWIKKLYNRNDIVITG